MSDLIPRQPKRKRQPTADCMREQLALAADEIIRLKIELEKRSGWIGHFFGPPHMGFMIGSAAGGYVDPTIIKGPRLSWWRRLMSEIAETPPADLPPWGRIIRAFQTRDPAA